MRYLVISHGPMSRGAVESAEMILGHQEHVSVLSVTVDSTIDSMYDEIVELVSNFPNQEWIILTDIIGGTPFNAAYRYLEKNSNVIIATGFNLPLLIELFMQPNLKLEDAKETIRNAQLNSMSIVDKVEMVETNEEDSFDL
ncbi:PTS sugar transporter subunit IIA [Streptococcus fryi]